MELPEKVVSGKAPVALKSQHWAFPDKNVSNVTLCVSFQAIRLACGSFWKAWFFFLLSLKIQIFYFSSAGTTVLVPSLWLNAQWAKQLKNPTKRHHCRGFKILQQQNYVCVHIIRWSVMNVWLVPWRARITIKSHFQLTREHLFTDHTDTVCFQTALSLCALCGRCHTVYWGCCVLSEYYSQQSYILYTACSKHLNCSISTSFQNSIVSNVWWYKCFSYNLRCQRR